MRLCCPCRARRSRGEDPAWRGGAGSAQTERGRTAVNQAGGRAADGFGSRQRQQRQQQHGGGTVPETAGDGADAVADGRRLPGVRRRRRPGAVRTQPLHAARGRRAVPPTVPQHAGGPGRRVDRHAAKVR